MEWLENVLGQKLIGGIIFLVLGVLLAIMGDKVFNSHAIGIILTILSLLYVIHQASLRYVIKFHKNTKKFKSGKEAFIANYFDKKKIKYQYEKPLKLGKQKLHPDFFLPEFDVYVEYWGMWPSDFDYRKECNIKRKQYKEYDIPLVELYPDNLVSINQLDWKFTERLLKILKK